MPQLGRETVPGGRVLPLVDLSERGCVVHWKLETGQAYAPETQCERSFLLPSCDQGRSPQC